MFVFASAVTAGCWLVENESPERYQREAEKQFVAGDAEKGFASLQQGIEKFPGSLELGNVFRAECRKRSAEDRAISFLESVAAKPGTPEGARFNLAFAYIDKIPRVGPIGAAFLSKRSIAQFEEVLKQEPDNWVAVYSIGMNYLYWPEYFKKVDTAIEYLQKCMSLQQGKPVKPYFLLAHLRLGDAHARKGDVERARQIWKEALTIFPNHPDLETRLAIEPEQLVSTLNEYYNPNKAIGSIDTDLSILWASRVPDAAVPLKRPGAAPAKSRG